MMVANHPWSYADNVECENEVPVKKVEVRMSTASFGFVVSFVDVAGVL